MSPTTDVTLRNIDPDVDDPCHMVHTVCGRAECSGELMLTCDGRAIDRSRCSCGRTICQRCVESFREVHALTGRYGCKWCMP